MNRVIVIDTKNVYFANRTLETLQLPNGQGYYLYNHQGQYYKLFTQKEELDCYLNALPYTMFREFYSEAALEAYLEKRD